MKLEASKRMLAHALEIIPGGTNTISKRVANMLDKDNFPSYIERAKGAYVWDLDGNKYIDYIASLSPINIGYNDNRIKEKVVAQLEKGSIFTLPSSNEVELSDVLIDKIPCAEMVRLLKTGAEVTSAAVRVARLATGKEMVLSCGYHGWHDWWSAKTGTKGIPDCFYGLIHDFKYNDYDACEALVEKHRDKLACIIMTAADYGRGPKKGFLEKIRALADKVGIPLIFDEIVTGFRWSLGGAQERYGVTPDMAAFGKGMANGMPIAALVGKEKYMHLLADNFVTSTFASEALSIAASLETIKILEEDNIIERLYHLANELRQGLIEVGNAHGVKANVYDATPTVKFDFDIGDDDAMVKAGYEFARACAARGVLIRRYGAELFLCPIAALSDEDVKTSIDVFHQSLGELIS
ncbi:MAG: aminotransferase class III-fold pyridoxal phosphate-dependent enzyme [candidate division KSB1 bacterium]|jgi:glutamate-1-semialdehyde aminotransferase|nr:aminotransferase class III-fold pyridoxal phosphate-dependent enzyme [candidate division KSB1 bacterium]